MVNMKLPNRFEVVEIERRQLPCSGQAGSWPGPGLANACTLIGTVPSLANIVGFSC
jgi:hypothetical protein